MKLGKIPKADIEMKVYPQDTSAAAVILGDYGVARFALTQDNDWVIRFDRHVRIKILKKEGLDWADFELLLYASNSGKEVDVAALKAYTLNMEDGKLEKTKLDRSAIFREKLDRNVEAVRFSLPNAKVNSILDVSYSLEDPFIFQLVPWDFQYTIPVRRSEFHVFIPEYFYYKNWINGYLFVKKDSEVRTETFQYFQAATSGFNTRTPASIENFDVPVTHWTYTIDNVPAFVDEPFITTPSDYMSSIAFELVKFEIPGRVYENFTKDWAEINKDMMDDYDFGKQLDNKGHLSDEVNMINAATDDPVQKMQMAYELIKRRLVWDKRYRMFTTESIRRAYNEGGGSSADINLNLIALMRAVGLQANPVLVSTRRHGKIKPGQVILTQFNHVIAGVVFEDKYYVLDATDPYCPYYILPPNTMNGKGMMLSEKGYQWVDLYSNLPYEHRMFCNLTINDDLEFVGTIQERRENFAALEFRKEVKSFANEDEFRHELEQDMEGLLIEELTITNLDSIYNPLEMEAKVTLQDKITEGGDRIYFNPILFNRIKENRFRNEERQFPIDFNYPYSQRYTYMIQLPEGYTVEELPAPKQVVLPDNGGKFAYRAQSAGNTLAVQYEYIINQTIFPSINYEQIRQFMELLVAGQAEQVVLIREK